MNKIINLIVMAVFVFALNITAQTAGKNVRLAKKIYQGNDFTEVMLYSYNANGTIKKMVQQQDGKLHASTDNFVFNDKGLLTSYVKTYNLDISPEKTIITYDEQNRVSSFEIMKTQNKKTVKHRVYSYSGDTIKVTEPKYLSQTTLYIFNSDSNIIKIQGLGEPSVAFTNLYNNYDLAKNPQTITGGFIDEKPVSKNNSLADSYADAYVINKKIEYQKIVATQYKSGGAKIPVQFKNGLTLKETATRFDKAYNKVMPVSVTT
ncbi:MAG: hypothetical protein ACQUYJ_13255, partial [Ferruginibacter sp.]